MGFWPTLKLSVHSPDNDHLRFTSRPLRYDNHVGFIIDADDPEGLEQGVGDLVKVGEKTFRCKPREECQAGIERFLERKAAVRTASKGGRL